MTGERRIEANQPIVFDDGTMQYQFRDFILRVDAALINSALNAVWGQIGGDIANQGDLVAALALKMNIGANVSLLANDAGYLTAFAPPAVRDEATDPYTLVLGDANTVIRFTSTDNDVTIPQNASVAFPVGTIITLRFVGTGTLTLTTTGLTINGTLPVLAQHVEVSLRNVGADEWDVI